jgi:hypothetical protein
VTVTIELSDEKAAAFKAKAEAMGLTVEEWLRSLGERNVQPESIVHLQGTEEWARRFREWADSHDPNLPVLSDEDMSRESIYPDRP